VFDDSQLHTHSHRVHYLERGIYAWGFTLGGSHLGVHAWGFTLGGSHLGVHAWEFTLQV
jgi:hypothetical protein